MDLEQLARDVVDVLLPIVDVIGALIIGVGVVVAFAAYVLSELRIRPRPYGASACSWSLPGPRP